MVSNGNPNIIFYLFLLFTIVGCGKKTFDSKESLWAHVKDPNNGLYLEKSINGVEYTLTYRPTDLLVDQELGENHTDVEVAQLREKYGKYLYFNLSMGANGQELLNHKVGNRAEFGAMVNQLAFGMDQKVNLISQSKDTIPLIDYAYPRMYGTTNSTNMLLVFERDLKLLEQEYFQLTIEDMGFKTGEVSFKINSKKISYTPKLIF